MKLGRDKKIAEEIRRVISEMLYFELSDPELVGVSVTGVKMTPDLGLARIYYGLPQAEERKEQVQKHLQKAIHFLRHQLASRIRMKHLPRLEFFYDESFEVEKKINELFKKME